VFALIDYTSFPEVQLLRKGQLIMKGTFFLTGLVLAAGLLLGCEKKQAEKHPTEKMELLLYCAAGIRPPVDELVETYRREHGVKIAIDYAGSEVLLSKIKVNRRGDLYLPGDKHYVEQAAQAGMILSRRPVFYWVPTILVQKGNPKKISGLEDLLKPGLKVGFGDASACAIGRTTRQLLGKNGIAWEDVKRNVAYQSLTVNELGMQIQADSLDAVIVWDAMARYYSEHGDQVSIAADKNIISAVDVGVLKFTKNKELAEEFVAFLTSERGKEIFEKHKYRTKPPG
jgi:molybdate transport system substrate-binding protein